MNVRRTLKWAAIALPALAVVVIAFVVVTSYVDHRKLVEIEKREYPAPGILVDVNDDGKKLHVYAEGEGEETLVFLAGFGTASPMYDFKPLYEQLSDDYRIAVVERAGYGWSDVTSSPRDIDILLSETRRALELAGESAPYVLFPHSMAGLEAVHWAARYPEEVEAIIGLDALMPGYVERSEETPSLSRVITFLTRSGLIRHQPGVFEENFLAAKKGHLTEEEAEAAKSVFFRRVLTENMWEEAEALPENARSVSAQADSDVQVHAFVSSRNDDPEWMKSITSYAERSGGQSFVLDAHHYVHLDFPELIAEQSQEIIEETVAQ